MTESKIGITTLQGKRSYQEDRIAVDELLNCSHLNNAAITELLKTSIVEANLRCGQVKEQGATLVTAIVYQDHIYTANVGDSSNYLVTVKGKDKITVMRLNENIHHPAEVNESNYIHQKGGKIFLGRLNGELAISRAIGDTKHGDTIRHTPDITQQKIDIPTEGHAFMITCSDGLTERHDQTKASSEAFIQELVQECLQEGIYPSSNPEKFSQRLATKAIEKGSEDNVSVIVTSLEAHDPQTKIIALFDGHGGDKVAEALKENFVSIVKEKLANLNLTLNKKK